ncbi:hypothetical protein PAXRUDRAFT_147777 [Paxillus rubicundulus Ve08.2h10]|uniref:Uncharacterized protein n=1 Tax=Paxillus rubicundulus Ve08.2h10 TaxID=930991 RepID=A0A0D0DLM0_9AGAM|nr:hypothetical protein PAXRUDRAFT_147777 [Paxillus rubicundulus Ve08.2h10]
MPGCALNLNIPLFDNKPVIVVQDLKHGLKTTHNQLCMDAHILSLGNFPIHFKMIQDMADHPLTLLFWHDVDQVDKQNNHAASCPFTKETLDFTLYHYSDHPALLSYLFTL